MGKISIRQIAAITLSCVFLSSCGTDNTGASAETETTTAITTTTTIATTTTTTTSITTTTTPTTTTTTTMTTKPKEITSNEAIEIAKEHFENYYYKKYGSYGVVGNAKYIDKGHHWGENFDTYQIEVTGHFTDIDEYGFPETYKNKMQVYVRLDGRVNREYLEYVRN